MILPQLLDPAEIDVREVEELSGAQIWSETGGRIWRAKRFVGQPSFYPVYRMGDLYSHLPLHLVVARGHLRLDRRYANRTARSGWLYQSGSRTLDAEVDRVGCPRFSTCSLTDRDEFVARVAEALRSDVSAMEGRHPGFRNLVLCGGRDSLNLLLLPWKNEVTVLSAPPNYDWVVRFVERNDLGYEVVPLEDTNDSLADSEILLNACRVDLEHCRWGFDLREVARRFEGRVVLWKGQLGDTFLTPFWKWYVHPPALRKLFRVPGVSRLTARTRLAQAIFAWASYYRGAMWQGAHMSILRGLTDALVLSAYHGPAMCEVLSQVDLRTTVQEDVRPRIGARLRGGDVWYPEVNPGPEPSSMRRGRSDSGTFLGTARRAGLRIVEG
jgi:hypothetical protein